MLRMKASAVIRKARMSPSVVPAGGEDVALEADVVGLGRGEGGEVVGAGQGGGAGVEGRRGRSGAATRGRGRARRGWARGGPAAGSGRCASGRRGGRRSRRRRPRRRSRRRRRGRARSSCGARSPGSAAAVSKLATWPSACTPVSVRPATVSCDRLAQDRLQRRLQLALHRALPRLARPSPRKPDAVVFDVEPDGGTARSMQRPRRRGIPRRHLESLVVRILLTNDDGISAPGLQAARRALREIDGVERRRDRARLEPQRHRAQHHHPLAADRRGGRVRRRRQSASRPTAPRSTASASPSSGWSAGAPT